MIKLNDYTFDPHCTAVAEKLKETGGSDAREFRVCGLIMGKSSIEAVEAELDLIAAEAARQSPQPLLQLREGRGFRCERERFERSAFESERLGSFILTLTARDPYEYSITSNLTLWSVTESGAETVIATLGNALAMPVVSVIPADDLVEPCITDGVRSLKYHGVLTAGDALELDCAAGCALLNGENALPYIEGELLRLGPGATTLRYTDSGTSHQCIIHVSWHDRWL